MKLHAFKTLNGLTRLIELHSVEHYAISNGAVGSFADIVFLMGASGSGKSFASNYLIDRIKSYSNVQILSIDAFGQTVDDKWIVNSRGLSDAINDIIVQGGYQLIIVEGTCDNIEDVIHAIGNSSADAVQFVVLLPNVRMWKRNNALKAKADTPFSAHFQNLANMSEKQLGLVIREDARKYIGLAKKYAHIYDGTASVVENNRISGMHSGAGWHYSVVTKKRVDWKEVIKYIISLLRGVSSLIGVIATFRHKNV